jgi:hypothetical protein
MDMDPAFLSRPQLRFSESGFKWSGCAAQVLSEYHFKLKPWLICFSLEMLPQYVQPPIPLPELK